MRIPFQCPQCGAKYATDPANAGKQAKCKCGQVLHIPKAPPEEKSDLTSALESLAAQEEGAEPAQSFTPPTFSVAPPQAAPPPETAPVEEAPDYAAWGAYPTQSAAKTVSRAAEVSLTWGKRSLLVLVLGFVVAGAFIGLAVATNKNKTVLTAGMVVRSAVELGWVVCALVALVAGVIGLISIAASRGTRTGAGKALSGMACAGVPFAIVIGVVVAMSASSALSFATGRSGPGGGMSASQRQMTGMCQRRQVALGNALGAYIREHRDVPRSPNGPLHALAKLYPQYVQDPDMFVCPSADLSAVPRFPAGTSLAGKPCCYEYTPPPIKPSRDNFAAWSRHTLLKDLRGNHPDMVYAIYGDGHLEYERK